MIITIDGPAGTGKSTVAKILSERLHFLHMDTGAFYRALTYGILLKNISESDEEAIALFATTHPIVVRFLEKRPHYYVGDINATDFLRSSQITAAASTIATYPEVRKCLVKAQQQFALGQNVVCEGRDMGTHVFPNAEIKIFLTANLATRAARRYDEMKNNNLLSSPHISQDEIKKEIQERDYKDSHRSINPLSIPQNAEIIDTSSLSISEVIDRIFTILPHNK